MILMVWRPRRDLNPCYRRERAYPVFLGPFGKRRVFNVNN